MCGGSHDVVGFRRERERERERERDACSIITR